MKYIFINQQSMSSYRNKYMFSKAQIKALLLLLNKDYFGDSLSTHSDLLFNLFDNITLSITGDDQDSFALISKLSQLGSIKTVNFLEETFLYQLSIFQGKLYIYKFAKSLPVLGITNKSLLRELYPKVFIEHGNMVKIDYALIKCLLNLKSIDPQILVPLVRSWDSSCQLSEIIKSKNNSNREWSIEPLIKVYNPRRIVQLLINEINTPSVKEFEFVDTLSQCSILLNLCTELGLAPQDYFAQKPQSLHQIHETLWREISKLKNKNIKLSNHYPPELIKLHGMILEEYIIEIPQDSHRLVDVGQYLSICVGGGTYRDKIVTQESFIILLLKDDQVEICAEVSNSQIIQLKGHGNKDFTSKPIYTLFKQLINN